MTALEIVQAMIQRSIEAGGMEKQLDSSDGDPQELIDALMPLSSSNMPPNPPDDCGHHFHGEDPAWHITVCVE